MCAGAYTGRELCLNLWLEQGAVWPLAPAANSGPYLSLKMLHTSSLEGFHHGKRTYKAMAAPQLSCFSVDAPWSRKKVHSESSPFSHFLNVLLVGVW